MKCRRFTAFAVMALALYVAGPGSAVPASAPDAERSEINRPPSQVSSLEVWVTRTNRPGRAFVKGERVQLWFENEDHYETFEAVWKPSRALEQAFSYATANLESSRTSRTAPKPPSKARELRIVRKAECEALVQSAVDRLVPMQPGCGIHCRDAFGDTVLFRDATGQVQFRSGAGYPTGVTIERRLNRQELASAGATTLKSCLTAAYPGASAFLLMLGTGSGFRLVLLDLASQRVVVLYPPRATEHASPARLGTRVSNLGSFILVDHIWTFLKNPVSATTRTLHQAVEWPLSIFAPHLRANRRPVPDLAPSGGMDLVPWEKWLDDHTHTPREKGSLRLLIDGDRFYPLLERRVSEAQTNVNIHVCIFDTDDVAISLADHLKQRSTNIEIKVVFDHMISRSATKSPPATPMREGFVPPRSIASYLREGSNVKVRPQPNPGFSGDHSKIFLVDQKYAYIGGMNVGREYRYEWHDLMAEVQGPVVASFQHQFDKKWAQVGIWGDCGLLAQSLQKTRPNDQSQLADRQISLRRLYTKSFDDQIRRAELAAIKRASSRVYAENPYFFDSAVLTALARARRRGVDVRVVMPSENDLGAGHKSNLRVANYLLDHGVRVYFYPGMTHVKALLADGWVCFGSANFDNLSLRLLGEADLATSDRGFVNEFSSQLFEADFARSRELREPLSTDWSDYVSDTLLTLF